MKTILRQKPTSPGSRRDLRSWVGPMAATCAWTFVGPPADRMRMSAKEWLDLQPDVILAHGTPATAAFRRETRTIPIVFAVVSDPVGVGFVESLSRPGGNLTGFIHMEASLGGKGWNCSQRSRPASSGDNYVQSDTAPYSILSPA